MLHGGSNRTLKVGSVRKPLNAGVLWSSLNLLYAGERKEKQVSLKLYIARGKKGIAPAQELGEECQPLDLRRAIG